MLLTLENIGKIAYANIKLNGITVIAGENNTGKSTVGKVLFSVYNSFFMIGKQIATERISKVSQIIRFSYHDITSRLTIRFDPDEMAEQIIQKTNQYLGDIDLLKTDIYEMYIQRDKNIESKIDEALLISLVDKINQIIFISDEEVFRIVVLEKLLSEFNMQICNAYHLDRQGKISLLIKDISVELTIKNNEEIQIKNSLTLNTEAIYIDDPFILDSLRFSSMSFLPYRDSIHSNHLKMKLIKDFEADDIKNAFTEAIASKKLDEVYKKLNSVCSGKLIRQSRTFTYSDIASDVQINTSNLSSGLKTFVILKTLLLNGSLEENGTVILDEPEVHLHPEWQLLFAELIVLIQREFNMHILINTHSPYFLNAIEVYSSKYGITNNCNYYLATNEDNSSKIEDVTECIEKIYSKLARPIQELENERFSKL